MLNVFLSEFDFDAGEMQSIGRITCQGTHIGFESLDTDNQDLIRNITNTVTDNPEEWISNLHNQYDNPYLQASEAMYSSDLLEQSIDEDDESFIILGDLEIPEYSEDIMNILQATDDPDVYIIDTVFEKGLLNIGSQALQFFKNTFGRWITVAGRHIFIGLKHLFGSDVTKASATEAAQAFNNLSPNIQNLVGHVELRNKNILERLLPGNVIYKRLGKDWIGKEGYRVSWFKQKNDMSYIWHPPVTTENAYKVKVFTGESKDVTGIYRSKKGKYTEDAWIPSEYKTRTVKEPLSRVENFTSSSTKNGFWETINTPNNKLIIYPGRLNLLNGLIRKSRYNTSIGDLVNRGAGYAIYSSLGSTGESLASMKANFITYMNRETSVTRAAESVRQILRNQVKGKTLQTISIRDDMAAKENFADLYQIYKGKSSKNGIFWGSQWRKLQSTHPRTVEQFLHIIGSMG